MSTFTFRDGASQWTQVNINDYKNSTSLLNKRAFHEAKKNQKDDPDHQSKMNHTLTSVLWNELLYIAGNVLIELKFAKVKGFNHSALV